ncbi:uncharacterized protein K452DRAFT_230920 [Aplosporella prunicola CBS 121167]|uniref:Uncharacterized protein n=1 Tax=Aplosporella prunicola CBS 121167 TaxID=1176127 RepID=A0A6A6BAH4_9PEZI|nr:uncharacterized protein K452DRAFT_230920 [Aplosporella prunicola CBS 121167]KAF2140363.1 hypothetical protein K452DRAFT_230920 [Aplosporella prunicola CBS 121167]
MTAQFPTRQIAKLTGHNGPVHAVTYSGGRGEYILTGGADRTIRLFNPGRGDQGLVMKYAAHGYEVLDLAVDGTQHNTRFASVGGDKAVFLWDTVAGTTVRRFVGHAARCNAVAFGAGGDVLVSGIFDGTAKLWDVKALSSSRPIMTLSEAKDSVSALSVHEHTIVAGSVDGRVRSYDIRMGMVDEDVVGAPITSLAATRAGDSLLVSSLDSTVRLFDRAAGTLLQAYAAPGFVSKEYRARGALGLRDSVVLAPSEDGSVFVWDLLDGKTVRERVWHDDGARRGEPLLEDRDRKKRVVSAVAFCRPRAEWCSAGGDGESVLFLSFSFFPLPLAFYGLEPTLR